MIDALARARNHFELFDLPVRFSLDRRLFESRYLELARATHPDFAPADQQAAAISLLARINEAYAVLGDDLSRAKYILQLAGLDSDRASPEAMARVFGLRERLSQAQSDDDSEGLEAVRHEAREWLSQIVQELGRRIDGGERTAGLAQLAGTAKYVARIMTS